MQINAWQTATIWIETRTKSFYFMPSNKSSKWILHWFNIVNQVYIWQVTIKLLSSRDFTVFLKCTVLLRRWGYFLLFIWFRGKSFFSLRFDVSLYFSTGGRASQRWRPQICPFEYGSACLHWSLWTPMWGLCSYGPCHGGSQEVSSTSKEIRILYLLSKGDLGSCTGILFLFCVCSTGEWS